tara:strand:+ start:774 stop:1157 length:384 start_codon:yes stop_codon:yes gene_type:complete
MMTLNNYELGRQREYGLMSALRKEGFFCMRGAGSKAGRVKTKVGDKHPIDILAIKDGQILFIQASKYYSSIDKYEKKYLKRWALQYHASPILAWTLEKPSKKNPSRGRWKFRNIAKHRNLKIEGLCE